MTSDCLHCGLIIEWVQNPGGGWWEHIVDPIPLTHLAHAGWWPKQEMDYWGRWRTVGMEYVR